MSLEVLALYLAAHFVGDYAFQPLFFVENKGKSWEVNFYHAATYTSAFVLFAHASGLAAFILLLSHFLIDPLKARYGYIPKDQIWMDQLLHLAVILFLWAFFTPFLLWTLCPEK